MGHMVTFQRPDGKDVQGYLAEPAQPDGAPAVVVIQEWWGLNAQIRGVAERLAQAGYLALVPDLAAGLQSLIHGLEQLDQLGHAHRLLARFC